MKRNALLALLAAAALLPPLAVAQTSPAVQPLTLAQAEQMALQNHPQIQAAMGNATVAEAQKREVRSAYYPNVFGSITGVESNDSNRIGAGALNSPRVLDKFAQGIAVSQLVTDFGRTSNFVKSADLHAKAQEENVVTAKADVLLQVDRAFYGALRAQALLRVAQQTVSERQLVSNQVSEMAANQLKSQLDVSFAGVDLAEAQLLLTQAQNNLKSSYAELTSSLGLAEQRPYQLTEPVAPAAPPADIAGLVQQAVMSRPELVSLRYEVNSAQNSVTAERDLWFPTISAVGAAGLVPLRWDITTTGLNAGYAAGGVNVNIPIFNGHQFGALRNEAQGRSVAEQQTLRNEMDQIVRDVNEAWDDANSGYQRLSEVQQLVSQANLAFNLATSRYQLGLSSIVELTQSQLSLTEAQIEQVNATYDYDTELSVLTYSVGNLR